MYIRREQKRRSSPIRVFIYTVLILLVLYVIRERPEWAQSIGPTPTPTRTATSYLEEAEELFARGELSAAAVAYEQAILLEPNDPSAYAGLAGLLIYQGKTGTALQRAQQSVILEPNNAEGLAVLCRALTWEGRHTEAYEACQCAIEMDPDSAEAYAYLAEVYADMNDWIPAQTSAEKAVALDYQEREAHRNLGYALEVQGRYRQAVEHYENAITLGPNLAALYIRAGRTYRVLGEFSKAIERFERAIRLEPTSAMAYDQLGWTYYANLEYTQAIHNLETAIAIDPMYAPAWGHLGIVYYTRQNYEGAIPALTKAIELIESDLLRKVRSVKLVKEIEDLPGIGAPDLMLGHFTPLAETGALTMTAVLEPVLYGGGRPQDGQACGDLIALNLQNRRVTQSLFGREQELDLSGASGEASFNVLTGELALEVSELPEGGEHPYEVRVVFRGNRKVSLGFLNVDAQGHARFMARVEERDVAPLEYYYALGLAYTYLNPSQCVEALPWLRRAVEIDPNYTNPAWVGLRACPDEENPVPPPLPTAVPGITPTP